MYKFADQYSQFKAKMGIQDESIKPISGTSRFQQSLAEFQSRQPSSNELSQTSTGAIMDANERINQANQANQENQIDLNDYTGVEKRLKAGEIITEDELKNLRQQNAEVQALLSQASSASLNLGDKAKEGTSGGQCGVFAQQITKLPSGADWRVGDTLEQKKKALEDYAKRGAGFYPGEAQPLPGNTVIFDEGTKWGHVAVINSINSDGTITLTESNYNLDEKVSNTRKVSLNDPRIVGFLRTKITKG